MEARNMSDPVIIEIETAIRPISCLSFQAGQKSFHRITVSFAKRDINSEVTTGHTKLLGLKLRSIRDDFEVTNQGFTSDGSHAFLDVRGQTASMAVGIVAINYAFKIQLTQNSISFSGAHDGYPSYNIAVNGKSVYDHVQGWIGQLAGDADTTVDRKDIKIE
jgi:hypothetical protein